MIKEGRCRIELRKGRIGMIKEGWTKSGLDKEFRDEQCSRERHIEMNIYTIMINISIL